MRKIFALFTLLTFIGMSSAVISSWTQSELSVNDYVSKSSAMYSLAEAPWGNETPYLNASLLFQRKNISSTNLTLDIIIFFSDASDYFGFEVDGSTQYCCWEDDITAGRCSELGRIYIDPKVLTDYPTAILERQLITFASGLIGDQTFTFDTRTSNLTIAKSGVYKLWAVNCGQKDFSDESDYHDSLYVDGYVTFYNPYGHLSGSQAGAYPLWWLLCIGFFLMGVVWSILCIIYRKDLLAMQYAVAVVIVLGFLESIIYGIDYASYNSSGNINLTVNIFESLFSTLKTTFALLTLLCIAMGLSVYRTYLKKKILAVVCCITCFFLIFQGVYSLVYTLRYTPAAQQELGISDTAVTILFMPALIMQFVFFCYIFWELWRSIQILSKKKQTEKLSLFKKLALVLFIAYLTSFIFLCIQVAAESASLSDKWWRGWWIWDQWWAWLHLILLISIAILWRPNNNNSRYAAAVELPTNEEPMRERKRTQSHGALPVGANNEEIPKKEVEKEEGEKKGTREEIAD